MLLIIAVLVLAGAFAWLVWTTKSGNSGSATASSSSSATTTTTTTTAPITPVPDADVQGFTTPPGPRCSGLDRASAIGRSTGYQVVVCQAILGRLTLKAVDLSNNSETTISGATKSGSGYTAVARDGSTYDITSERLTITRNGSKVADERWAAYTQNG